VKFLLLLSASLLALVAGAAEDPGQTDRETATAIFAGGCFWCMEPPYDKLDGVISTTSGYIGGTRENPTYQEVSSGRTGHTEAVRIVYDPAVVDYQTLLDVFWVNIDPLTRDRQFCDRGSQYRAGIFYLTEHQQALAEASKQVLVESGRFSAPIVTEITPASAFYAAEDYHQDYYLKNALRYKYYRYSCGRDKRLEELWGQDASIRG
jgi:peptide-methionine (S)-S-oxide reductase